MINKILSLFLSIFIVVLIFSPINAIDNSNLNNYVDISGEYISVYYGDKKLYSKNADAKIGVGSLINLLITYLVIEKDIDFEQKVVIKQDVNNLLRKNDQVTVNDLLYSLIVTANNYAAAELANLFFGGEKNLLEIINKKAIELGATNTHFSNLIGDENKDNYSTCNDMSKMLLKILDNKYVVSMLKQHKYHLSSSRILTSNLAYFLNDTPEYNQYFNGAKSTFSKSYGYIFFSYYNYLNVPIIIISAGDKEAPKHIKQHYDIYKYLLQSDDKYTIIKAGDYLGKTNLKNHIFPADYKFFAAQDVSVDLNKLINRDEIKLNINIIAEKETPLFNNDKAGYVEVMHGDTVLFRQDLKYERTIYYSFFNHLLRFIYDFLWIVMIIILLIAIFLYFSFYRYKRAMYRNKYRL